MQCQTRRASCEPRSKPAARLLLRQAGLCVAVRDSDLAALAEPPIPGIEDRGACEREESATARVRWRQSEALRPRQNKRKRGPVMSVDGRRECVRKMYASRAARGQDRPRSGPPGGEARRLADSQRRRRWRRASVGKTAPGSTPGIALGTWRVALLTSSTTSHVANILLLRLAWCQSFRSCWW